MELADLLIFMTVVEQGGIVKAARRLHRVPSSVTMRVKQLEASVGVQLFYRDRQRLFLSPAGEVLLAYAEKLLRLSEEAKTAVSGSPPSGVLKLGALESTAASRLPEVLAAYHHDYPNVHVELRTGTNDALTEEVAERRLDAAFVAETPADRNLAAMPLFAERLTIISSIGHRRIDRPQDVAGDTIIAFPNGCAYRRVLQRWLGNERVASIRVLELASYHAIVACVASGTGIALVPESVLEIVQHAHVTRHALPKVHANMTTPLIWRAAEQPVAVIALRKTLHARRREGGRDARKV
jgi:DNA-binding transcriptional LysR family regulator